VLSFSERAQEPGAPEIPACVICGTSCSLSFRTIYGLNLVFLFYCICNLLARVYKVKALCSWGSAFGQESPESVLAQ
jgi:hypothetical protein